MGSAKLELENSSSDEDDGDEQWRAAINSVASSYAGPPKPNSKPDPTPNPNPVADDDHSKPLQPQPIKHYQLKAQKALDEILEKSLIIMKEPDSYKINDDSVENGGGVRLFKRAPVGIVFDHQENIKGPEKKPRLIPGEDVDEKSKKFKNKLKSVVVEGTDILAAAEVTLQHAKARLEAKETIAKEAAKKEEERVTELKKIRGERWLPSMAKEMQTKLTINACTMK